MHQEGEGGIPDSFEDISTGITTEEIIKMYENVEMKDGANQISVDNILKMYETEEEFIDKSWSVVKSTKKQRNKKISI